MTSDIIYKAIEILSPVILAILGWLAAQVARYIQARVQQEYLRGVLIRLTDTVFTVVKELDQTMVDALKEGAADGKLTDVERAAVKERAVAYVKSYLGAKGLDTLGKVLGLSGQEVDSFLSSKVESAVNDLRATKAPVVSRPFVVTGAAT